MGMGVGGKEGGRFSETSFRNVHKKPEAKLCTTLLYKYIPEYHIVSEIRSEPRSHGVFGAH